MSARTDGRGGRAGRLSRRSAPSVFEGEDPMADKSPKKQAPPKKLTTKEKKAKKTAKNAAKQLGPPPR